MSNNKLEAFPEGLFTPLKNVIYLILDANNLTTVPASMFTSSRQLTYLHLQNNRIKTLPSVPFSSHLKTLSLFNNLLTTLPDEMFTKQVWQIEDLQLQSNLLTKVPRGIFSAYTIGQYSAKTDLRNNKLAIDQRLCALTPSVGDYAIHLSADDQVRNYIYNAYHKRICYHNCDTLRPEENDCDDGFMCDGLILNYKCIGEDFL
ncbi:carboxypeptidase N subunit 2-like [Sycon ciliatum]|uniref:carboxypeptidase N subunit 2-like n=1 Tax=Sycon ciliatum TaxID=27933 RepID=UPI0031F70AA0